LPESRLLTREEQIERDLLIQRAKLGAEIGRQDEGENLELSQKKREGVIDSLPKTKDNFSAARRVAISSIRFNDNRDLVLKTMLDRLDFFEKQCEPFIGTGDKEECQGQQVCQNNHVRPGN
jgi:transposase